MTMYSDLSAVWMMATTGLVVLFVVSQTVLSRQRKSITLIISLLVTILMSLLMFGLYPALAKPLFVPRSMYGAGVFISLIALGCADSGPGRWLTRALTLILSWSLISFACAYGNALYQQSEWENFRRIEVIEDLTDLSSYVNEDQRIVQVVGTVGYAPTIENASASNPVLPRLVPVMFRGDWMWGTRKFANYYGLEGLILAEPGNDLYVENYSDFELQDETSYHAIYVQGDHFVIELR